MKKKIIVLLLSFVFLGGIYNSSIFGWTQIVQAVIFVVVDNTCKFVQKKVNDKNGTHYVYTPAPGYSQNDKYWTGQDLVNHFRDYYVHYGFENSDPPSTAMAALPKDPGTTVENGGTQIASKSLKTAAASEATSFPLDQYKSQIQKGDILHDLTQ